MQLLYFITTVISQVQSARHHQRAGYSALPSVLVIKSLDICIKFYSNSRIGTNENNMKIKSVECDVDYNQKG